MKGNFKVIGWALILSLVITLSHGAPADKDIPVSTAASGSQAESSSQAGQESVPVPDPADTRADAPASTGGSASVPVSKPTATVGTFFDNIFNIPTSVLRAVNQFLNNNIKIGQGQSSKTAAPAPASVVSATGAPAAPIVQSEVPVSASTNIASATTNGVPNKSAGRATFFDNIFNIPISAINSVNSLITGRRFGENGEKLPTAINSNNY